MVAVETGYGVVLPLRLRQESTRADDRVADVELVSPRDDEEAITRASEAMLGAVFGAREERPELLMMRASRTGFGRNNDEVGGPPVPVHDGERWLAVAVLEHERGRGCDAAP